MNRYLVMSALLAVATPVLADTVIGFEDAVVRSPSLAGSYWAPAPAFTVQGTTFDGGFYAGFSVSNSTKQTDAGYLYAGNEAEVSAYSPAAPGGAGGSSKFAVAYVSLDYMSATYDPIPVRVTLPTGAHATSVQVANTTLAALVMRDGDPVFGLEKFGGAGGSDADWFKLTVTALDASDQPTGTPVEHYLADYRFADNAQDYIQSTWTSLDLSPLGTDARTLLFSLSSSDVGTFGMNTPAYFALDNLTLVPEPSAIASLLFVAGMLGRRRNRS
jgi:hypothetical protein